MPPLPEAISFPAATSAASPVPQQLPADPKALRHSDDEALIPDESFAAPRMGRLPNAVVGELLGKLDLLPVQLKGQIMGQLSPRILGHQVDPVQEAADPAGADDKESAAAAEEGAFLASDLVSEEAAPSSSARELLPPQLALQPADEEAEGKEVPAADDDAMINMDLVDVVAAAATRGEMPWPGGREESGWRGSFDIDSQRTSPGSSGNPLDERTVRAASSAGVILGTQSDDSSPVAAKHREGIIAPSGPIETREVTNDLAVGTSPDAVVTPTHTRAALHVDVAVGTSSGANPSHLESSRSFKQPVSPSIQVRGRMDQQSYFEIQKPLHPLSALSHLHFIFLPLPALSG